MVGDDFWVTKEFDKGGTRIRVEIGRPTRYPAGPGWRCQVRIERGDSRFEQSQVVAPTEQAVARMALDLVTSRLALTEAAFFRGATVCPGSASLRRTPRTRISVLFGALNDLGRR
ncbi:hypothetical protein [Nocardia sp. NPDC050710]|uniref:hypothetical protein n=1 Tax=Nocardia sp. NPDC050710 TaxID=3157220 RepID=UPI0033FA1E76